MSDLDWFHFFSLCNEVLGKGSHVAQYSDNWCSWTTFEKLQDDCSYWQSGLPNQGEFNRHLVKDGGVWGQPFPFNEIAHLILPAKFCWEGNSGKEWVSGQKQQDIKLVSERLVSLNVPHRLTDTVLEIKLY